MLYYKAGEIYFYIHHTKTSYKIWVVCSRLEHSQELRMSRIYLKKGNACTEVLRGEYMSLVVGTMKDGATPEFMGGEKLPALPPGSIRNQQMSKKKMNLFGGGALYSC